jgi:CheY-like chemotaxis protein
MRGPSVLVVDDHLATVRLFSYLLRDGGFRVLAAGDVESALELIDQGVPDLVVLDVQLPGIEGIELLTRMRGQPRTQATPVVVVSACAMLGDEERCLRAGCAAFLTKPIDTRTFVPFLHGVLETGGSS